MVDKKKRDKEEKVDNNLSLLKLPFFIIFRSLKYVSFSIFFSILIEWIGLTLFLNDSSSWVDSRKNAEQTLIKEVGYLGNFTQSSIGLPPQDIAKKVIITVYPYLTLTKLSEWTKQKSGFDFKRKLNSLLSNAQVYLDAAVFSILTVLLRCLIFILSIGLFVLFIVTALVDGLVERQLRMDGVGGEHGFLYHRIKLLIPKTLTLPAIIYLSWPTSINPTFILVPAAWLLGVLVYQLSSKFMGYL